MEIFKIIVLCLSGLALLYASSMRLFNPKKANFLQIYFANPENKLEYDTDLVNEIRGIGAVMLLGGIAIFLGIILPDFRSSSFVVAIVIFFGVASGRLMSVVLDGKPNKEVIRAMLVEVVLSVFNVFCLLDIIS